MLFNIVLVVQLVICLLLVGSVLMQKGKGSAGLIGGGGGSQGVFGASGGATFMTRTTAALATIFFILSLVLSVMVIAEQGESSSVMEHEVELEQTSDLPVIPK